ncbi:MAG: hypothetical protein MJY66_08375 [Bacteroidaceae bacterium]|nr:hypothetical protein [Bacteroidaceae bacterium]
MNLRVKIKVPGNGYKWRECNVVFEAMFTVTRPELEKIIKNRYGPHARIMSIHEDLAANPILKL